MTSTVPASGSSRPVSSRISVVLPAPSGPTRPVMRPGSISMLTPSSAAGPPGAKRLVTARAMATGPAISAACGRPRIWHADRHRLALAQRVIGVGDDDAQPVDEVGAQAFGLHGLRRELGGRRDEADGAGIAPRI